MLKAFFPENEAASQNMGNVFFGIGALVAPALTATLLDRLGYARGLMFLAIAALVPALAAALTAREAFVFDGAHGSLGDVLSRPVFWIAAIVFLLYGPLEGSLGFWATRYLTGIGFRERISQLLLTLFWLSFLTARLVTALVQKDWARRFPSHGWIIIVLALAAAVAVGNMAGARTRLSAAIGFLLVGAFLGPIFPSLVAVLFGIFDRERGTAYGAMFSIGAAGSLVLPPVIGIYARRTTLQRAMRIPVILALFLALAALVLAVIQPGR
jgi:fucose permease